MFDGIKISSLLKDAEAWKQATSIDFSFYVTDGTGEKVAKKKKNPASPHTTYISKAHFETYTLKARETHKENNKGQKIVTHWLNIDGSLHKNYFGGANYQPFKWQNLQKEIDHLKTSLHLEPGAKFDNLEIGVNILMPFPVFPFLQKNLISYKGSSFKEYLPDENGTILGYYCPLTQYDVKMYDKGLQFSLPYYLMRFELRYKKMEILNRLGIYGLQDLKSREKVNSCLRLLLEAWDEVLLYDYNIDVNKPELTPFQRDLLMKGTDRTHWEILKTANKRQFNDHRQKFRALVLQHGNNHHSHIREQIEREWNSLMINKTTLPTLTEKEMYKMTIKVKCQNVHPRECLTCGKDISHQRKGSKYCSERINGKEGKRCRNGANNPRNNRRRKIEKIVSRGVLFDITPYIVNNRSKWA